MQATRLLTRLTPQILKVSTPPSSLKVNNYLNTIFTQHYQFQVTRSYAKSKDRKKESKGKKPAKVEINEEQMRALVNVDTINTQMQKAVDTMRDEFVKNLSLRSTTGAIETLKIAVDGSEHELQELGQIVRKNPKTIVINLVAFPQTIPEVLAAIQKSGMNLNPQQDGTTLFIPVPKVTKEHRDNLAKNAKTLFVKCKDAIRDVQMQHIKKLKRQGDSVGQDESHSVQNQIAAIGDKFIKNAENLLETKQKELSGGA